MMTKDIHWKYDTNTSVDSKLNDSDCIIPKTKRKSLESFWWLIAEIGINAIQFHLRNHHTNSLFRRDNPTKWIDRIRTSIPYEAYMVFATVILCVIFTVFGCQLKAFEHRFYFISRCKQFGHSVHLSQLQQLNLSCPYHISCSFCLN